MATNGTISSIVMSNPFGTGCKGVNEVEINWTSSAAGLVTCDICAEYNALKTIKDFSVHPTHFRGKVIRIVTNPGATAPTDNYSITVLDKEGADVLQGLCVGNRSSTLTQDENLDPPVHIDSELTFTITGAGNAKVGKTTLYIKGD